MTHKEYRLKLVHLKATEALVKRIYGNMLGRYKEDSVLIDVTDKLSPDMDDSYWDNHHFIALPLLEGETGAYYFIFAI